MSSLELRSFQMQLRQNLELISLIFAPIKPESNCYYHYIMSYSNIRTECINAEAEACEGTNYTFGSCLKMERIQKY